MTCFCISRRLTALQEEEEEGVNCKAGPKPVRYLGPSTSTQIKVKNSAAVRVSPASASETACGAAAHPSQIGGSRRAAQHCASPPGTVGPRHTQASWEAESAENGAVPPPPAKVLLCDRKSTPHRVIKLKRTPLCVAMPSLPSHPTERQASSPEALALQACSALGGQTENGKDQVNG